MVASRKKCIALEKTGNVKTAIIMILGKVGEMGPLHLILPINPIVPINPIIIHTSRLTEIIHD